MLPIRDENPNTIVAWVTLAFIAASILVYFGIQLRDSARQQEAMLYESAAIFGAIVSLLLPSRLVFGSPSRRLARGVVETW